MRDSSFYCQIQLVTVTSTRGCFCEISGMPMINNKGLVSARCHQVIKRASMVFAELISFSDYHRGYWRDP